jgi:carboxyl-terminal processing protease
MNGLVIGLVARLLFAFHCYAQSHEPQRGPIDENLSFTKTDPAAYLNQALDEMQKRALRRNAVDWDSLRAQAHNKAANAKLTVDSYDAIRFALASLGDHHSSFHPTPALEQLEAERKGHPVPDDNTPQVPMSPFVGRYEPDGKIFAVAGKRYALLVVPKCFPDNDKQFVAFETKIQQLIALLDSARPEGWIVDLRGNVGGNMWPMIGGLGPILGESDNLGEFFATSGHSVWTYRDGVASEVEDTGKQAAYPRVDGTPYKMKDSPAVAVLIDNWTGSSGEAVAIALRGRPRTRFFGEHTQGVSTENEVFKLSDGASMWLTIGVDADRTGKQYLDGLDSDETVKGPNPPVSPENDPVVMHAVKWLDRNPS